MSSVTLMASERSQTGKSVARKIRRGGNNIPASIYSNGEPASLIIIDSLELEKAFERTGNPNTILDIQAGEYTASCLVKEVQRHPVSGAIRHVDFYKISNDVEVTVEVPVKMIGRAVGTTLGGKLRLIRRTLPVRCLPANIPATVDVDVTSLDIGQFLKVDSITNPEGATIVFDDSTVYNVVTVIKRRGT